MNNPFLQWKFVDNKWFWMACTGVAVILWLASGSVAIMASKDNISTSAESVAATSAVSAADDVSGVVVYGSTYGVAAGLTGVSVVFLIFVGICMYSYGAQQGWSSSGGASKASTTAVSLGV
jgi:hypothetical protein